MPADNILTFKKAAEVKPAVEARHEEEKHKEIEAFNRLYSDYLGVRAKLARQGLSDEDCDALCDLLCDLTWQIIRTPAPADYHLNYKFEVMREIMDARFVDGRHHAMLESIRNDVLDSEKL